MLMYRHHLHDSHWVAAPPSNRPSTAPLAAIAEKMANALARPSGWVKVMLKVDGAAGARMAAKTPRAARAATRTAKLPAAPPTTDAAAKPTSPMIKVRRTPTRWDNRPPSSRLPKPTKPP
jgi:hypothetical protein